MKYIVMIFGVVGLLVLGAMGFVLIATVAVTGQVSASVTDAVTGAAPDGPVAGIPPAYLADTVTSGARFGVPWSVLAGIYRVECDFGRSRLAGCNPPGTENRDGAQGPGQFLAPTWRRGLGAMTRIPPGPPTTSTADGFATDGDGDGVADPWDAADAVASTARMLAADGGHRDIATAVFAYDHSRAYVDEVLSLAAGYRRAAATTATSAATRVVAFARSQLGAPYRWGGAGPGGWDCSGLVMVAYERVGIDLPHNALAQYDATRTATVPLGSLDPGDLVFFGPDLGGIEHVGIYVGGGDMIDAPHTGAVVRREPIGWDDLLTATRPLAATGVEGDAGGRAPAPRRDNEPVTTGDGRGITQLLVDFGQVITLPQPASTPDELARVGGVERDGLVERYWAYRPRYDAGLSDVRYWSTVVGRPLDGEPDLVEALVAADTASWMHLDMRVVDAVVAFAGAGRGLALLSNAPHRIADEVDAAAWAAPFDHRIFSCRLGVVKPDPAIFATALDVTGAGAATTLFVDDRVDNIEAAAALGLRVHHFAGVDGLLAELARS